MRSVDPDRLRAGAVAAGVVGGLLRGATGDYGDADASRSRVLPANHAFGVGADLRRVAGPRGRRATPGTAERPETQVTA